MKKLYAMMIIFLTFICFVPSVTAADTSHQAGEKSHAQPSEKMDHTDMAGKFENQMVDKQVRAEFQIMSLASMNMKDPDGATHHVMVKLYDNSSNQPVKEAVGKIKVIGPDKKEQVNGLKNYNGIFAANFTFNKKDKYGVICLVKINGEKHLFKFWYPHE
jgi:hypothetical protein